MESGSQEIARSAVDEEGRTGRKGEGRAVSGRNSLSDGATGHLMVAAVSEGGQSAAGGGQQDSEELTDTERVFVGDVRGVAEKDDVPGQTHREVEEEGGWQATEGHYQAVLSQGVAEGGHMQQQAEEHKEVSRIEGGDERDFPSKEGQPDLTNPAEKTGMEATAKSDDGAGSEAVDMGAQAAAEPRKKRNSRDLWGMVSELKGDKLRWLVRMDKLLTENQKYVQENRKAEEEKELLVEEVQRLSRKTKKLKQRIQGEREQQQLTRIISDEGLQTGGSESAESVVAVMQVNHLMCLVLEIVHAFGSCNVHCLPVCLCLPLSLPHSMSFDLFHAGFSTSYSHPSESPVPNPFFFPPRFLCLCLLPSSSFFPSFTPLHTSKSCSPVQQGTIQHISSTAASSKAPRRPTQSTRPLDKSQGSHR